MAWSASFSSTAIQDVQKGVPWHVVVMVDVRGGDDGDGEVDVAVPGCEGVRVMRGA